MIPAKISNLNPVQVSWYELPYPEIWESKYAFDYLEALEAYNSSLVIADVENIHCSYKGSESIYPQFVLNPDKPNYEVVLLKLNQSCFIEPTGEGKCKIIRL